MFPLPLVLNGASMCITAQDNSSFIILSLFSSSKWFHLLFFITISICPQDSFWKAVQTHEKLFQLLLSTFISILSCGRSLWWRWWWYQWFAALTKLSHSSMTENTINAMTILKLCGTWPKSLPVCTRTLIHGILQCAVGFHHLFNQVGASFVGFALLIYWFSLFTSFFFKIWLLGFWWFVVN